MGSSLSLVMAYGIVIKFEDDMEYEARVALDKEEDEDFCFWEHVSDIISTENKNPENPCKLEYTFVGVNDHIYGFGVYQKGSNHSNYDCIINLNPSDLEKEVKHDDFLIRVSEKIGFKSKPTWFAMASYG
jgi:hypothetical protein